MHLHPAKREQLAKFKLEKQAFQGGAESYVCNVKLLNDAKSAFSKLKSDKELLKAVELLYRDKLKELQVFKAAIIIKATFILVSQETNEVTERIQMPLRTKSVHIFPTKMTHIQNIISDACSQAEERCEVIELSKSGWVLECINSVTVEVIATAPLLSISKK